MSGLVSFNCAGGVPCYYARENAAYGDLSRCTKSRTRQLSPATLKALAGALRELDRVMDCPLGSLVAVVSGGAYVDKPGPHSRGRAFDIGALHWRHRALVALDVATQWDAGTVTPEKLCLYLGTEAILRARFGTVLGMHFAPRGREKDHWNHWHVDDESPVGYWSRGRGSETRVRYLQESLTHVWEIPCGRPDGDEGPKTRHAIAAVRERLSIGCLTDVAEWRQYLFLTAIEAVWLQ